MKHRKITAALAVVLALSLLPVPAFAAEEEDGTYTKVVEGLHAEDGEYSVEYDKEIEIDGVKYVFDSVSFVEDEIEKETYTEDSDKLYQETIVDKDTKETKEVGKEEVEFPETVEKDGVTYVLTDTNREEFVEEGRKTIVTLIAERNASDTPQAPATYKASTYIDPATGTEKELPEDDTQVLEYLSSELVSEGWGNGDFTATMRFNHYEYAFFDFMGTTIEKNEERPMDSSLYPLILQSLNLDPAVVRITDVSWDGAPYAENGAQYRNVSVKGDRYNRMYNDTYDGQINIPDIVYSITTATYEESDEDFAKRQTASAYIKYVAAEEEETETETAEETTEAETVTPQPEEPQPVKSPFVEFITSTPGIILVSAIGALAVAIIIMIIATKKKKKDKN